MGFAKAVGRCYVRMFNFSGRAPRSEYWWFFLFQTILMGGLQVAFVANFATDPEFQFAMRNEAAMEAFLFENAIIREYGLMLLAASFFLFWLPNLSVTARRLHDTNRRGWNMFMPTLVAVVTGVISVALAGSAGAGGMLLGVAINLIATIAASILLLVWLCSRGTSGPNRFGDDPLAGLEMMHPAFAEQVFGDGDVAPKTRTNFFETKAADSMVAVGGEVGGARAMAARKAAARDYYQRRVLPSIQKADPRPDY